MIAQIVAVDMNYGIGKGGDLLFHISNDLKRFKELTINNYAVFARKTYESLPYKPLPNRRNVVITSNAEYKTDPSVIVETDFEKMVKHYIQSGNQDKDLMICGGSSIYKQSAPYVDKIYMTRLNKEFNSPDVYFPSEILRDFHITDVKEHWSDKYNCRYEFITYERNKMSNEEGSN